MSIGALVRCSGSSFAEVVLYLSLSLLLVSSKLKLGDVEGRLTFDGLGLITASGTCLNLGSFFADGNSLAWDTFTIVILVPAVGLV